METSVFKNNQSQAVRIPKELAFPDDIKRVHISRRGQDIILTPLGSTWESFFQKNGLGDDFPDREQPVQQERDDF